MNGGRIVLADEPTGALDSQSGVEVMALLRELSAQGHTVVLITHAQEVADQAQRVIEVRDGRIVSDPGPAPRAQRLATALAARHPQRRCRGRATRCCAVPRLSRGTGWANLVEATRTALRALRANLSRTVLTLLGIVIGVASVIAMLAIGDGAKQTVLDRISAMGTNLLLIRPGPPVRRGRGRQRGLPGARRCRGHCRLAQCAGRRARTGRHRDHPLRRCRLPDPGHRHHRHLSRGARLAGEPGRVLLRPPT